MSGDNLDAALTAFLDLLLLIEEPGFAWGLTELRAAFQWGDTLQQLLYNSNAASAVQGRLQVLQPRLPAGLQLLLPAIARQPLQVALELLLRRPAAPPEPWLEAVLAAYMTATVLPKTRGEQAAAEQQLTACLASLQQAAALQDIMHAAAQQAAAQAAASLRSTGGAQEQQMQRQLLAEALHHMTSPASLQVAAAAHLVAKRMHAQRLLHQHQQPLPATMDVDDGLTSLMHSPPTPLELQVLCYVALLPCWEGMLRRLARLPQPGSNGPSSSLCMDSSSDGDGGPTTAAAAQQALQLLCGACSTQPQEMLGQHPALLAEVCRQSFRFTVCYAGLLAGQQRRAAEDTQAVAEAAAQQLAHATKHQDHVSDYLRAKVQQQPSVTDH